MWQYNYSPELYHYGVMGMRWGHRKQRPITGVRAARQQYRNQKRDIRSAYINDRFGAEKKALASRKQAKLEYKSKKPKLSETIKENNPWNKLSDRQKKAVKIGAAVAGAALLTYGAYKVGKRLSANKEAMIQARVNKVLTDINGNKRNGISWKGHSVLYKDKAGNYTSKFVTGSRMKARGVGKRLSSDGKSIKITPGRQVYYDNPIYGDGRELASFRESSFVPTNWKYRRRYY